jgi:hypothetical protein
VQITDHPLELHANRPVVFPFHTSTTRRDKAGAVVPLAGEEFSELAPLHTVIRLGRKRTSRVRTVPVELVARYTELGTLEMWAQAKEGERRWRLELDTRARAERKQLITALRLPASEAQKPLEQLGKALEETLGSAREGWTVPVIRALFDVLLEERGARKRSPYHEARWTNLAGFFLRPGFGSTLDFNRIAEMWKVYLEGMQHPSRDAVRLEWFVAWRRIAGGLSRGQQETLFSPIQGTLLSKGRGASKQELAELWRLAASLEHLGSTKKRKLGEALLEQLEKGKAPPRWGPWAMGRLGGRVPLYGPIDRLVPTETACRWLERMLALGYRGGEMIFALVQMARLTGDRARDVTPELRKKARAALRKLDVDKRGLRPLDEVVVVEVRDQAEFFGDSVPMGLVLKES